MALDLSISRLGITSSQLGVAITLAGLSTVVSANGNGDPIIADVTAETGWPAGATILTEQSLTVSAGSGSVAATLATDGELTITGDWSDAMSALLAGTTYTAFSSVITLRVAGEDVDARITFSVLGQNADPLTVVAAAWWDSRYVQDGAVDFFYDAAADVDVNAVNAPTASGGVITFDGSNDALQGSTPQFAHNTPGATYVTEYTLPDAQGSDASQGFSIAGITRKPDGTWWVVNGGLSQDGEDDSGDTGGSGDVRQQSIVHLSADFSTVLAEISTDDLWTDSNESPQGIAWDEANGWLWVLDPTGLRIRSVNEDGTLNTSENITRGYIPGSVCMAEDGNHLWVMSRGAGDATIQKILTDGTKVVVQTGAVDLDDRHDHIIEYGGLLYISCGTNNGQAYVMVLDPATLEVLGRATLPYPGSPNGLAGLEGLWLEADGKCYIAHNGYFHYGTAGQAADTFPRTNVVIEYTLPTIASENIDLFWLGNPTSADYDMVFQNGNTNGGSKATGALSLLFNGGVSALDVAKIYVDSSGGDTQRITGMTFGSDTLIYVTIRGTAVTAYQDGAQIGTATLSSDGAGLFGLGRNVAEVGGCVTNSNRYFPGEWRSGGIIIGGGERQRVEGILAHRHSLTSLLPSDHPFKTLSPATPLGDVSGIETAIGTPDKDEVLTVDLASYFTENTLDPIASYAVSIGSLVGSTWTVPTETTGAISATVTATTEGGVSGTADVDYTVSVAAALTIDDFPDAAGERTATYTPGNSALITSQILVADVQRSQVVFAPVSSGQATIQTAPTISGGTAVGDTLTATLPDVHHDIVNFGEATDWIVDGAATGNDTLEIDRTDNQSFIFRHQVLDGDTVVLTTDTEAGPTVTPVVNPDLTDSSVFQVLSTSDVISVFLDEDEEGEALVLDGVVRTSGTATLGTVDLEAGTFGVTTPGTEGTSVFTATISNGSGGVSTKTITVNATEGEDLAEGTTALRTLTYDTNLFEQSFGGDPEVIALQNSPDNPTAGVAFGIFTGTTGLYDVTTSFREDVNADDTTALWLYIDDVLEKSWTAEGANGFADKFAHAVSIANGDKVEWRILGYQGPNDGGGPVWAATDDAEIKRNYVIAPTDSSDASWNPIDDGTLTGGVADLDGGTNAITYTGVDNGDGATAGYTGTTATTNYTLTLKVKARTISSPKNVRIVFAGKSAFFRLDTTSVNNSGFDTATITALSDGWFQLTLTADATATSGDITFLTAQSDGSAVEAAGSWDLYELSLTET